jgi:GNAT superfamily N-acetyltransferase
MDVPASLTTRALTSADAEAVFAVAAADEEAALGRVEVELADIIADWQRPSFDLSSRSVGVFDNDLLVGYGQLTYPERGEAAVLPAYLGQGIGTALAGWLQQTARAQGATVVGMPVPEGSAGDRLLTSLGYHIRWTSWVLHLPEGASVPDRELPRGYAVRQVDQEEYLEAHDVVEDAFLEWSTRDRESFGDFEAEVMLRPGFEPWHLRAVFDPDGRVAAVAALSVTDDDEVYVSKLATRADQRGRGLAQCLLLDCFAEGRRHGGARFGLSTDSRTGALGLYQKVGMTVSGVWVHRAIHLT